MYLIRPGVTIGFALSVVLWLNKNWYTGPASEEEEGEPPCNMLRDGPVSMILLLTTLLIVLLGGSLRMQETGASRSGFPGGTHSARPLAWYCPAPPVTC
jgi:hypothetical protein